MLVRAVIAIGGIWAIVFALAGLMMQLELNAPGIQVYLSGDMALPHLHNEFWRVHTGIAAAAGAATLLGALGLLALQTDKTSNGPRAALSFSAVALLILGAASTATVFLTAPALRSHADLSVFGAVLVTVSVLAAVAGCARTPRQRRGAAPWVAFAAALGLLGVYLSLVISGVPVDLFLPETYTTVAVAHAFGGAGALLAVGLLSALANEHRRRLSSIVSVILAGAIALSLAAMVMAQWQLGLAGMPRLYADYPESFSLLQARASFAAYLALALFAVACLRLALARMRPPETRPADVF